ncbi:MAG: nicotinate-nucleotide adenylyltransferase [Candidatus Eisenbacteria bacterium]|nr:nicotinate-nucleotide adenylyltransferase [Candidatus Eisenbacteria bacterium]
MSGDVVIFGGTFDPIHVGHLILAECAADALGARDVLFVPAGRPPHKGAEALSSARDREEMVRLALEGNDRFALSRTEIEREGRSFAIDTIREIARAKGGRRPYYFIGADSLVDLPGWRSPEAILEEAEVVVAPRPGFDLRSVSGLVDRVRILEAPRIEISSTLIRRRVRAGESIRYLVPESVRAYILRGNLYRDAEAG